MKENEIYLGDAYELIKEIPNKSIDLIITDPPYEISNLKGGGNCIVNGSLVKWAQKTCFKDLGSNNLNVGINEKIFDEFMRVMKIPNIYIWCNAKQIYRYLNYFVGVHKLNFQIIVWNKTNAMPLCGGKYLNDCEYCLYFYKGVKLNTRYETAKTVYYQPINMQDKKLYNHPTIKPMNIIKNLIINSSVEGGVILDPFIGSGTTSVAAKEMGRKYIGFEINQKYYEIAIERLKGITQEEKKNEQLKLF